MIFNVDQNDRLDSGYCVKLGEFFSDLFESKTNYKFPNILNKINKYEDNGESFIKLDVKHPAKNLTFLNKKRERQEEETKDEFYKTCDLVFSKKSYKFESSDPEFNLYLLPSNLPLLDPVSLFLEKENLLIGENEKKMKNIPDFPHNSNSEESSNQLYALDDNFIIELSEHKTDLSKIQNMEKIKNFNDCQENLENCTFDAKSQASSNLTDSQCPEYELTVLKKEIEFNIMRFFNCTQKNVSDVEILFLNFKKIYPSIKSNLLLKYREKNSTKNNKEISTRMLAKDALQKKCQSFIKDILQIIINLPFSIEEKTQNEKFDIIHKKFNKFLVLEKLTEDINNETLKRFNLLTLLEICRDKSTFTSKKQGEKSPISDLLAVLKNKPFLTSLFNINIEILLNLIYLELQSSNFHEIKEFLDEYYEKDKKYINSIILNLKLRLNCSISEEFIGNRQREKKHSPKEIHNKKPLVHS